MTETKLKHLEFVQATIGRLAQNSFAYKGWAITVVGGIVALSATSNQSTLAAYVALIAFWFLDAHVLRLERFYRCLYDEVVADRIDNLSMTVTSALLKGRNSIIRCATSVTMLVLYGGLALTLAVRITLK